MSKCGCNRWGPGTTCERPQNTAASREMEDRLKAYMAERAQLDTIWSQPPPSTTSAPDIKQTSTPKSMNRNRVQ